MTEEGRAAALEAALNEIARVVVTHPDAGLRLAIDNIIIGVLPLNPFDPEAALRAAPREARVDIDSALRWVREERIGHAGGKWTNDKEDAISAHPWADGPDGWRFWLLQYLDRAKLLGLDTPRGLQALGKFATTAIDMLASIERVYGPLPAPGLPSGEITEWVRAEGVDEGVQQDALFRAASDVLDEIGFYTAMEGAPEAFIALQEAVAAESKRRAEPAPVAVVLGRPTETARERFDMAMLARSEHDDPDELLQYAVDAIAEGDRAESDVRAERDRLRAALENAIAMLEKADSDLTAAERAYVNLDQLRELRAALEGQGRGE